jgi:hypothetical protein
MPNVKVIESDILSVKYNKRYVIVDEDTGELIDDAQGYGFKKKKNAWACYKYKIRHGYYAS